MSEIKLNKVNKKPYESRAAFLVRLAEFDAQDFNGNATGTLPSPSPELNNVMIGSNIGNDYWDVSSNCLPNNLSNDEDIILLPENDSQETGQYIISELSPVNECIQFHDTHSTNENRISSSELTEHKNLILSLSNYDYSEETDRDYDNIDEDSDDSIADKNYEPPSNNKENLPLISYSSDTDSNDNIVAEANSTPTTRKKKLTRKRLSNPDDWQKNVMKRKRKLGEEYINAAKKKVEKRKMKESCNDKCRIKCSTKISEDQRRKIFNAYWKLGSINRQRGFIDSHISEITPVYKNTKQSSNRSKNLKYTLRVEDKVFQVCKTFFKNTLAINNRTIFTTTKKKDKQGFLITDQRGRHSNQKRINDEVIQAIRDHINSFPRKKSHYCRNRTNKEYLDGSLNIATMYRLYKESCEINNKEAAKISMYSKILNTETNIAFHVPKKDQCGLCASYINGNEEQKNELGSKYEAHLSEKELSRQEKIEDVKSDENIQVLCFDFQAVLTTPCGEISSFYYKRRLSSYNFTIFDLKEKVGHCFFWHEGIAKRGANEIGSCIYNFLKTEACKSENVIFYSDNCSGQNKNKFLFSLYLFCVMYENKIKTITHKFLEKGHTQNEGDSMHATIEKEKKRVLKSSPIYIPAQWATIIKSAKKTGVPYNVNEICTQDIYDLKSLSTEMGKNFVKNTEKEKVVWNDLKIIKVEKKQPNIIFYKTSYTQDSFKSIDIRQNIKQLRINQEQKQISLKPAYKTPPSIEKKKKKDLLDLCRDNSIRPVYWSFYESLSEKPDGVEECSESDTK